MLRIEDRNSYVPVMFDLLRRQEGIQCIEPSTNLTCFDRECGCTAMLIQVLLLENWNCLKVDLIGKTFFFEQGPEKFKGVALLANKFCASLMYVTAERI